MEFGKIVPASLYEIIAYFGSACVLTALIFLGFVQGEALEHLRDTLVEMKVNGQIFLLIIFATIGYAYGQLASALSAPFIAQPISKIVKQFGKRWTRSRDFTIQFKDLLTSQGFSDLLPENKLNNKWTLLFYLLTVQPEIAKDLLKRHARERLARINAFNSFLMAGYGLLVTIYYGAKKPMGGSREIFISPSYCYIAGIIILGLIFSYEYYLRKGWNNDLMLKVFPAVILATTKETPAAPTTDT